MAYTTVLAYAVNSNGSNGSFLGGALADANGNFTVHLPPRPPGPVRLTATGGYFISEMNSQTVSLPSNVSALVANPITNISAISINPLADFENSITVKKLKAGATFANAFGAASFFIKRFYGLVTDPTRIIPSYAFSSPGTDAGNLGLVLGALINEDQYLCPTQPGELSAALSADISDGIFDGTNSGAPILYCSRPLTALAGITGFQDALSGLNQLQNVTQAFAFGGKGNVLTNAGLANRGSGGVQTYALAPLNAINTAITGAAPPVKNSFAPAATDPVMNVLHSFATATLLPNGKVLIIGSLVPGTDLYNPATNTFAPPGQTPTLEIAREEHTATLLPSGKVLIAGGDVFSGPTFQTASTEIYDFRTNTFSPGPSLSMGRAAATATLLPNGKVLIAGGQMSTSTMQTALASTELYDPATNRFALSGTAAMNTGRFFATATLLPNGKVLIAGGTTATGASLASTELYDPASNSFATSGTANMNQARQSATATLLPNGKVLIAGGLGSLASNSTDLYDPATNSFAATTPTLTNFRFSPAAALLPNGRVLIAGGADLGDMPLSSTDIYNPTTNTITAGAIMNQPRSGDLLTVLPNGKVLIAVGNLEAANLSCDVYTP
jgi:hypothetical protein